MKDSLASGRMRCRHRATGSADWPHLPHCVKDPGCRARLRRHVTRCHDYRPFRDISAKSAGPAAILRSPSPRHSPEDSRENARTRLRVANDDLRVGSLLDIRHLSLATRECSGDSGRAQVSLVAQRVHEHCTTYVRVRAGAGDTRSRPLAFSYRTHHARRLSRRSPRPPKHVHGAQ